jgi:hypothetical protein
MACKHSGPHRLIWQHREALDAPYETWPKIWQLIEWALPHTDEDYVGDQIPVVRELIERTPRGGLAVDDALAMAACTNLMMGLTPSQTTKLLATRAEISRSEAERWVTQAINAGCHHLMD